MYACIYTCFLISAVGQVAERLMAIMVKNPRKERPLQRKDAKRVRDPDRTRSGRKKRAQHTQQSATGNQVCAIDDDDDDGLQILADLEHNPPHSTSAVVV